MPTLFEMMVSYFKTKEAVESKFYNPYKIKVGELFRIDTIDYEHLNFKMVALREVKRELDGKNHFICDYDLLARNGNEEVNLRLRLIPIENPDGEINHHTLLLRRVEEFGYDKEWHHSLAEPWKNPETNEDEYTIFLNVFDEKGQQIFDENNQAIQDQFWRVNDVKTEWHARTSLVRDENNDGTVEDSEVEQNDICYWDYWRETIEDDVKVMEFYIIEMDDKSGYFQLWRGMLTDPERIIVHTT